MSDDGKARDGGLTWLPLVGAGAVALLIAVAIFFIGPGQDSHVGVATASDGSLSCPATYEQRSATDKRKLWVPVDGSGIDGSKHLTPDGKPSHVTVCYYRAPAAKAGKSATIDLTGHRTLTAGLGAATHDLHSQPAEGSVQAAPCQADPATSGDDYLVGMTFATGVIWVSAPGNSCAGSGNGEFAGSVNLAMQVGDAYTTRVWK